LRGADTISALMPFGAFIPFQLILLPTARTLTGVKEYSVDTAAAIIAALPTLAVCVVAGAWFVCGLAVGAVKG
jgi:glucose/mannose transport system permease protein